MGRMLGPAQYGEMTAIMSLLMIGSVGGGAVLTVAMRYSGEVYHTGSHTTFLKLYQILNKYIFIISIAIFILAMILLKPVTHFFNIDTVFPVIIAFISFIFSFMVLVNKGFLQGTQKFGQIAFMATFEMLFRLVLGILLVKVGLSINGAIGAIILAGILTYLYSFWPMKKLFKETSDNHKEVDFEFNKKEIINYTWPTTLTMLLLVVSLNIDIILIKHFFSASEAGTYAAISTVAKIILYGTAPIVSVMFPMISEKIAKGNKHYKLFLFSLIFTIAGAALVLAIFMIMPSRIISILYGNAYLSQSYLLPELGIFILLYTIINLFSTYYLAIKDFTFVWFFLLIIIGQVGSIFIWHSTILIVVQMLIISLSLLFGLMVAYYLYTKRGFLIDFIKGKYEPESEAFSNSPGL